MYPILAKPSGPPLVHFLARHKSTMYAEAADGGLPRILPRYIPLIYQWALQLLSGLSFVHSHSVIFGDICAEVCWLSSPSLDISLVGFLSAGFMVNKSGVIDPVEPLRDEPFHHCNLMPFEDNTLTVQTDLFQWACFVYELATSFWPGHAQGSEDAEIKLLVERRTWPVLEKEYLGDIVKECWDGRYDDIASLKSNLLTFLGNEGWKIKGEDELDGLNASELFEEQLEPSV
jgi:serine/threonine protein kinase